MNIVTNVLIAIVAVAGWYQVHKFNLERDRENKKRDLLVQYLIEAYQRIERAANRPRDFDNNLELESAISDIQLFGNKRQAELAKNFAFGIGNDCYASTDELLINLRDELRKELGLEKLSPEIAYLRLDKNQQNEIKE